eukprot:TRINITY_DN91983_c0_g1_i1.p1 TRINITY_DN91983_c0_g1~~TRINITY_DN91983_c0_g1_i1.p1  ORF type:complete len:616 (+),score=107.78 TRINITY_DN91983_c0_g1_i1:95-1849(+)
MGTNMLALLLAFVLTPCATQNCATSTTSTEEMTEVIIDCEKSTVTIVCHMGSAEPNCTRSTVIKTTSTTSISVTATSITTSTSESSTSSITTSSSTISTSTTTTTSTTITNTTASATTSTASSMTQTFTSATNTTDTSTSTLITNTTASLTATTTFSSATTGTATSTTTGTSTASLMAMVTIQGKLAFVAENIAQDLVAQSVVILSLSKYLELDASAFRNVTATSSQRRLSLFSKGRRLNDVWSVDFELSVPSPVAPETIERLTDLSKRIANSQAQRFATLLSDAILNYGGAPSNDLLQFLQLSGIDTQPDSRDNDTLGVTAPSDESESDDLLAIVMVVVGTILVLGCCCFALRQFCCSRPASSEISKDLLLTDLRAFTEMQQLEAERWALGEEVLSKPALTMPIVWSGSWTCTAQAPNSNVPRLRQHTLSFKAGGVLEGLAQEQSRGRFRISGGAYDLDSGKLLWREVPKDAPDTAGGRIIECQGQLRLCNGGRVGPEGLPSYEIVGRYYEYDTTLVPKSIGQGSFTLTAESCAESWASPMSRSQERRANAAPAPQNRVSPQQLPPRDGRGLEDLGSHATDCV